MGLLDKYIAKIAGPAPDMTALLTPLLGPDDELLASAMGIAEAFERGGGVGTGFNALLNMAVNTALTAHAESAHIGGAEGSIAQTLPRDSETLTLVVSRAGLSAWKWDGYPGEKLKAYYRVAAEHITSIADTGKGAQGGARICRVTFIDDSFFDYRLMSSQAEFLLAANLVWPVP